MPEDHNPPAAEDIRTPSAFAFEGREYPMQKLMLAEARAIQRATHLSIMEWEKALSGMDAEALTALIWVHRRRAGEANLRFEDVDGDLSTFDWVFADPDTATPENAAAGGDPGKDPADDASPTVGPQAAEA